ncbi:MAG: hypothetical protein QXH30_03405 [Candidatus Bilamarchaeaceae archaeon]
MLDLPSIAQEMHDAFKARNMRKMRKINDKIQAETALNFSTLNYKLAVYSYVLGKILSKPRFLGKDHAESIKEIEEKLRGFVSTAKKRDLTAIEKYLDSLKEAIDALESSDSRFIKGMIDKGKLKTAAILYAQGISLSAASEMTGVEKQEIMDYAGKTMMFDRMGEKTPLDSRLKKARRMLLGE